VTRRDRRWHATPRTQQRQAAEPDADDDRQAAADLTRPPWVTEGDNADDGPDERLQVEERPRDLGGHPLQPEGEQAERDQGAGDRHGEGRDQRRRRDVRDGRQALGRGERQRAHGRAEEQHGGERDRVPAFQQAALRDRHQCRDHRRHEDQEVTVVGRPVALSAGDQHDAAEGQREASPGYRAGDGTLPYRHDDGDQDRWCGRCPRSGSRPSIRSRSRRRRGREGQRHAAASRSGRR
jgi:hypothetical protein